MRPDALDIDIALILLGNAEVVERTETQAPGSWKRYAALQIEALRAQPDAGKLPPAWT